MVWFYCDGCCDTIKKPKLVNHFRQCGGHSFTCVDCSRTFDRQSAQGHSTCVSEHEKYALGVTKPGGYASQGFFKEGQQQPAAAAAADKAEQEVLGMEFLSERLPWRCSCCNVNCTSRDTLLGHATGVKHKRRARAALGLTGQQQQQQNGTTAAAAEQPEQPSSDAAVMQKSEKEQQQPEQKSEQVDTEKQPASKELKKEKKEKNDKSGKNNKRKQEAEEEEQQQEQQIVDAPVEAEQQQEKQKSKRQKKTDKKKKKKESEEPEQQQQDAAVLEPLLKVAKKKLKKKGKLGLKKLEALLKENANGSFNTDVMEAVKQQLLACAEVELEDSKLHWKASS